ncbi:MAG TPA: FemAB family XrtA/PEP-CTERM system-associated protein [Gemmatimonadaceae bacterium]|jgi:FemAB-related protein (PEP-CTERM system-associated)|nr:FemAB family XrtA/PEP-CTERM system-associated protein [Gemmatimonadaceae bacterium]
MTVEVERFGGTEEEWDAFASAHEGYTHFHRLRWRALMERVFGHECLYLAARDWDGALIGVLPLVRVRSLVFGHYLVSMPFLNYGGPLGSDKAVRALVDECMELARRENVKLLELRSRIPLSLSIPASHRKLTVVLDLAPSSSEQFKRFEPKLRSQIRRPQKEGVTVRFGPDQVSPFFSVFARHMRDLGTPTQSLSFFREVAEQFSEDSWFACAYLQGEPVAAGCGFRFGDEFEMTWASSLRMYNREAPNMLLYWACMERAINEGVKRFNFGRCSPGSGTHRFKMQWGGREEALWWYDFAASPDVTTPSPDAGAFRFGPRIWRRLPARLTTAVGPAIVRYLP